MWVKFQHSQVRCEGCQVITSSHPENAPRRTPCGGNEDQVSRRTDEGVTAGTVLTQVTGMSVAMTRMMGAGLPWTRVMLGLVLYPGVELPQSRSVLLGGPCAVRTSLLQALVQLGLVPLGAVYCKPDSVLMVLSPHGSYWELDLQLCWSFSLLGSGYRGQDFECWVLRELDFGWSDSQLGWASCHADWAYREPRVLSCWAVSFGRASY